MDAMSLTLIVFTFWLNFVAHCVLSQEILNVDRSTIQHGSCGVNVQHFQTEIEHLRRKNQELYGIIEDQDAIILSLQKRLSTVYVTSTSTTMTAKDCPADREWIHFNSSCYFFGNDFKTWNESSEFCKQIKAHLVVVTSEEENNFIVNYTKTNHGSRSFWIDGTDAINEGQWVWSSTGANVTFINWIDGEPNDSGNNEDCVMVYVRDGYTWNDARCSEGRCYICEKEL